MEGSNYWGYGYKTHRSYPKSRLITWRWPVVKFGRNAVKRNNKKIYQDEDKIPQKNFKKFLMDVLTLYPIYQTLRSGRIWHKVNV